MSENFKQTRVLVGVVFLILITLQSVTSPLISSFLKASSDHTKYVNYSYFFAMSSYTLIIIGVMIFNARGMGFITDHFSLWIIVLSCFLRTTYGGQFEFLYKFYMSCLGLILLIYVIRKRKYIKVPPLISILFGLSWAGATILVIALLELVIRPAVISTLVLSNSRWVFLTLVFNLSFVTVIEETFFRGLLFGFLISFGVKEDYALIVQGVLFWLTHYMRLSNPLTFFIFTPLLTISVSLIMKRYKVIYLPILVHTLVNVFGPTMAVVLYNFLFK